MARRDALPSWLHYRSVLRVLDQIIASKKQLFAGSGYHTQSVESISVEFLEFYVVLGGYFRRRRPC
jgi:hypothetical protein